MNEQGKFEEADLPPAEEKRNLNESDRPAGIEPITPIAEKVVAPTDIRKSLDELHLPDPQEVLNKVVEAAERNQAIEKMLERSHEIKDYNHNQQAQNGPTAVGELIKSRPDTVTLPQAGISGAGVQNHGRLYALLHDNSLYGHAIRYGFVTAVCALLVAILITLLFT